MLDGWRIKPVGTVDFRRSVTGTTIAPGWAPPTGIVAITAIHATRAFRATAVIGAIATRETIATRGTIATREIIPMGAERSH
jgi:hypothetical protein